MPNTLSVQNLGCERGEQCLFENINFSLDSGEVMQVRGLNGSGKTSLLRMVAGLAFISEGSVHWNDNCIEKVREEYYAKVNYIGHKLGFKDHLSAVENLTYSCIQSKQKNNCSIKTALEQTNIANKKHLLTRDLSAGQQRRMALAKLLLLPNPLWILDEPFSAIDKEGVDMLTKLMQRHSEQGGMIIFTSHQRIALTPIHKELNLSC